MTKVIYARNVNDALHLGLHDLRVHGVKTPSRNGQVIVSPRPVITEYARPEERVLFWGPRDANPFFHLVEAMWMLAGRNDVELLDMFNKNMKNYSDDGISFRGAYGYRWRRHFGHDQIKTVIDMLSGDPYTRRAVIQIFDSMHDHHPSKDVPCNTTVYFNALENELDMTVCCRSNDVIWGAYGANAVHFSFLHEVVAHATGMELGHYRQLSNNYHIYEPHWPLMNYRVQPEEGYPYPIIPLEFTDYDAFTRDLEQFLVSGPSLIPNTPFLRDVVRPMMRIYLARKEHADWKLELDRMPYCDWKQAAIEWIERRNHVQ